ncbi:BQ5605_C010g06020 [Microbotryum silenes-dioicae]|uniref:BQ5605_C010g06020 protein n=1 Tax=Microbotryum silenes-dioicae TaxID=796604 RepID=A0A2X0LQA0_9BASI|nr:BQ5605_C010g06020 [Microbotryum silenes-dioicae]
MLALPRRNIASKLVHAQLPQHAAPLSTPATCRIASRRLASTAAPTPPRIPLHLARSYSLKRSLWLGQRSTFARSPPSIAFRTFSSSPLRNAETTNLPLADASTASSSSSSSSSNPNADPDSKPKNESLSQRLKTLFRTHGWSALSIYLLLSAIDFSLTFLLIYAIGADKVRIAEDYVLDALGWRRKDTGEPGKLKVGFEDWKERHPGAGNLVEGARRKLSHKEHEKKVEHAQDGLAEGVKGVVGTDASGKHQDGYSAIATTAVLAYAIHKTLLLPVRVGLTVAITPKFVRTLQSWGWNVGMAKSGATTVRASTAAGAKAATAAAP